MSEFLLALLTLSGLLPVAKVLTMGADREEGMKSSEDFATHPNKYLDIPSFNGILSKKYRYDFTDLTISLAFDNSSSKVVRNRVRWKAM
ncbi:hypothetical protein E5288_WYG001325 [Bos mutus]|uniref:Uncharacterized protein n=1 Tax=Bos mutus TaxID=72004 RepID=A0A6B0R735_9CETA|nr:hypothetical protein [Bos mutus]